MPDIWTAIISALIGGLVSYVGASVQNAMDMRSKIDESLRNVRTDKYAVVWEKTGLLPQWPRARVTYAQLAELSRELRGWYFGGGGMYLSTKAQKAYSRLQKTLNQITASQESEEVSPDDYDLAREKCSALRTELTKDLLSRTRARSA